MSEEEDVIYEQKTQLEHIIDKPNMYIGSINNNKCKKYIFDDNTNKFILKEFICNDGLYKIIDEAFSNASDHFLSNSGCNTIKIQVKKDPFKIKVWNNSSKGIPIVNKRKNKETGKMEFIKTIEGDIVYNPELIFGNLLTSSNYDKSKARITNGTNGLGIKLTNIYSTEFKVKCADGKKLYKQTFSNSMREKTEPEITNSKDIFVSISFKPNLDMFHFNMNNDFLMLIKKMVYDMAYVCNAKRKCDIYYNNELLNINSFNDYIALYQLKDSKFYNLNLSKQIQIGFAYIPFNDEIKSISFINNHLVEGGTHIDFILKQIFNGIKTNIKDETIKKNIQLSNIRDNCCIYMNCYIDNPSYDSQCKFMLKNKFKCAKTKKEENEDSISSLDNLSPSPDSLENNNSNNEVVNVSINKAQFNTYINKILKETDIMDTLNGISELKNKSKLKKTDGKKTNKRIAVEKYEPAKLQGTSESIKCGLMITEGDSAKSFAMIGRDVLGSDYYGVFPIRGKMLNTRNASIDQISNNAEITKLKQILGLKDKVKYNENTIKQLNYGYILILTDQDLDGYHIRGLIVNFIHTLWPELIELGFCKYMNTPIKIASPKTGNNKNNEKDIIFYNEVEYQKWYNDPKSEPHKYTIKYYKGLGSSAPNEIPRYFKDFDKKLITYIWENEIVDIKVKNKRKLEVKKVSLSEKSLILAFDEKWADQRKEWLSEYDPNTVITINNGKVKISDFIHNEFKHFSNDDNIRSVPRIEDGLKPSQRKILFTMLENKIYKNKSIKVANLASKVSDRTNYLHGETSLTEAIFGMGQDFVGSNNINLLYPNGVFGSFAEGGADHAAGRYPTTYLNDITNKIFRPEDDCILKYLIEEGKEIEPEVFYPIIPMILVNGSIGIGTGYSTTIPSFNPFEIIDNLEYLIKNAKDFNEFPHKELIPYYYGFNGTITPMEKSKYHFITKGKFEYIKNSSSIRITALPIGCWTTSLTDPKTGYYSALEDIGKDKKIKEKDKDDKKKLKIKVPSYLNEPFISSYINLAGTNNINIEVDFIKSKFIDYCRDEEKIYEDLHLVNTIHTLNMYLHEVEDGKTKFNKFDSANDIIIEFYNIRYDAYVRRKEEYLKILNNEIDILKEKIRFMKLYMEEKIIIHHKTHEEIIQQFIKYKFKKLSSNYKDDESKKSYSYLDFKVSQLSKEKFNKLCDECEDKEDKRRIYMETPIEDIWINELEELRKELINFYNEKEEIKNENKKTNKTNKRSKK